MAVVYISCLNQSAAMAFAPKSRSRATTTQAVLRSTVISLTTAKAGRSIKATGKVTVKDGKRNRGQRCNRLRDLERSERRDHNSDCNHEHERARFLHDDRYSRQLHTNCYQSTKTGYTFDPANSVLTKTVTSR